MQRHAATRINQVWTYDFIHDQTDDGGRLKWLPVVDAYSRELLSLEVARSITAEDVVRDLERLVRERGAPEFIRSDNGPSSSRGRCGTGSGRRASRPASSSPANGGGVAIIPGKSSRKEQPFYIPEIGRQQRVFKLRGRLLPAC